MIRRWWNRRSDLDQDLIFVVVYWLAVGAGVGVLSGLVWLVERAL